MTMNRTNVPYGVLADLNKWGYEAADNHYKAHPPLHKQGICELIPISEVEGEYLRMTTALSITDVPERAENEGISEAVPTEGFTVWLKKRRRDVIIPISYELKRDFTRSRNFLEDFVKTNAAPLYTKTVDQGLTDLFNYGGYTAGDEVFRNTTPNFTDPSGAGVYDGTAASPMCFFNRSGNNRTPKGHSTTYYNGIARNFSYDYLVEADTLLTATNAKMEDGTPFVNTEGLILMVHGANRVNAERVIKSNNSPDDANSFDNPMKNGYRIVINPFIRTASAWAIGRAGFGIKLALGPMQVNFWLENRTNEYAASIGWDYIQGVWNYRLAVGSNWPTS